MRIICKILAHYSSIPNKGYPLLILHCARREWVGSFPDIFPTVVKFLYFPDKWNTITTTTNHSFTAIIQVNLHQPAPPVKNWRILLVKSFTARAPLLTATSAFGLGRKRWISPQQCYLHCLHTFPDKWNIITAKKSHYGSPGVELVHRVATFTSAWLSPEFFLDALTVYLAHFQPFL